MSYRVTLALILLFGAFLAVQRFFPADKPVPRADPIVRAVELPGGESSFSPEIRVNVTPDRPKSIRLKCDGPYRLVPTGKLNVLSRGTSLSEREVKTSTGGFLLGQESIGVTSLELIPENSPAIWVDGHQYRGRLRLSRLSDGSILAVNLLPLEDYLASVVDSEMPIAFGAEARTAQAIAARTYALYQMRQNLSHPSFDVFGSERSQKYLGYKYVNSEGKLWAGESDDSRAIVRSTGGIVCTTNGKLFCTYFSAACGGRTVPGSDMFSDAAAPLSPVDCEWCRDAPLYRWTREFSSAEMTTALRRATAIGGTAGRTIGTVRDDVRSLVDCRPADLVQFQMGNDGVRIPRGELRARCLPGQLPSPLFRVEMRDGNLKFEGRGHGHGVGFCQWGARGQALAGRTAAEILAHYYPGSELKRIRDERDIPAAETGKR